MNGKKHKFSIFSLKLSCKCSFIIVMVLSAVWALDSDSTHSLQRIYLWASYVVTRDEHMEICINVRSVAGLKKC